MKIQLTATTSTRNTLRFLALSQAALRTPAYLEGAAWQKIDLGDITPDHDNILDMLEDMLPKMREQGTPHIVAYEVTGTEIMTDNRSAFGHADMTTEVETGGLTKKVLVFGQAVRKTKADLRQEFEWVERNYHNNPRFSAEAVARGTNGDVLTRDNRRLLSGPLEESTELFKLAPGFYVVPGEKYELRPDQRFV